MYYRPKSGDMLWGMATKREEKSDEFGARLKTLRERAELSQEEVGKALGMTQSGYSHYEKGTRFPDPPAMAILAELFNTSVDYMVGLTKNKATAKELEDEIAAATGKGKINKIMERLSRENQLRVISYAEFLLSEEKKTAKPDEVNEWITYTEVLLKRLGIDGEQSFTELLTALRPDFAAALGVLAEKERA